MEYFWSGFEKRAFLKPGVAKKLKSLGETIAKAWKNMPKPRMPTVRIEHKHDLSEKTLHEIDKTLKEMRVNHDIDAATAKKIKDISTHAAEKAEEVKKFKPKDLIVPAVVGSAGIAGGTMLGRSMGRKLLKHTPLRENRQDSTNSGGML